MIPAGQFTSVILLSSREPHFSFRPLLAETFFAAGLERSAIIAITASIAVLLLSLLAAYALPRSRSRHGAREGDLFVPLMFAAMFVFLPLSLVWLRLNVLTPGVTLIIIYALAVLPYCIWQLHCSLNRIPSELEDAARIDGCSAGQLFRHVVLPSIAPNLVVTAICSLIAAWSLNVVAPSILRLPGSPVLFQQANGFASAAVFIAAAPLVVLCLVLSVYLMRQARPKMQVGTPS